MEIRCQIISVIYLFIYLIYYSFSKGQQDCSLQLSPNIQLPGITCNATSYDCDKIMCSASLNGEDIRLSVDIDQWQDPMEADVTLSVPMLGFDWSGSFKDGENIEIPGFPLQLAIDGFPIGEIHVSLQFSLKKENGNVDFKVLCLLSRMVTFTHSPLYQLWFTFTVKYSKNYPHKPEPMIFCDRLKWFLYYWMSSDRFLNRFLIG